MEDDEHSESIGGSRGKQHIYHVVAPTETMDQWMARCRQSEAESRITIQACKHIGVIGYESDALEFDLELRCIIVQCP